MASSLLEAGFVGENKFGQVESSTLMEQQEGDTREEVVVVGDSDTMFVSRAATSRSEPKSGIISTLIST